MNIAITALEGVTLTDTIQIVTDGSTVGLYLCQTQTAVGDDTFMNPFSTTLTAQAIGSASALSPGTVTLPMMLPVAAQNEVVLTASGTGEVAYTYFGGGWSTLCVDTLASGAQTELYSYVVEETAAPHYIRNTSAQAAQQQYVSALFSGYQLGIIGLQEQDGQQVPGVSPITGTSDAPVADGRVFGDLSAGLPASLNVVYKTNKTTGPLAPNAAFCGSLSFAAYNTADGTLGTTTALLSDVELSDFDVGVNGTDFCVFSVTGDGAPLLAMYDTSGTMIGTATMPVGSWNNAGRWIASPTVIGTPGQQQSFTFAFVEMEELQPQAIYTGTFSNVST